jgi:hypothetical protein
MEIQKRTRRHLSFEIPPNDRKKVEDTADRLGLSVSEIIRRSLRVGLKKFERVNLPGSIEEAQQ